MNTPLATNKRIQLAMAGIMLGVLLSALDSTCVGTAMPKIIGELQGMEHYSWPFLAYLLCSSIAAVVFGKLADLYGRKNIFLLGMMIFVVASALCGLSSSMISLIVFRGIQGLGGGILVSNAFSIAGELFQGNERGKVVGMIGSMFGLASLLGPALGGFITDHFGWRWVFYLNLPIGFLSFSLISISLRHKKMQGRTDGHIDFLGITSFIVFIVPLLLVLSWGGKEFDWQSELIISLLAVTIVSLDIFFIAEFHSGDPMLPLWLFKKRIFIMAIIGGFFGNIVFFGAIVFLPLYLQEVQMKSASISGLMLTPMMVSFSLASIGSGQIASKLGKTKLVGLFGFLLMLLGCCLLIFINSTTHSIYFIIAIMSLGFGLGAATPIFNLSVQASFPQKMIGLLTGTVQLFRNIGGTLGIAVLSSLMSSYLRRSISTMNWGCTPNNIRILLSSPKVLMNSAAIESIKGSIPESCRTQVFHQIYEKLASGISFVFFAAAIAALIALVSGVLQNECYLKQQDVEK